MGQFGKSLIFLFIFAVMRPAVAYPDYSSKCLDDCFNTHHECSYCNYQCQVTLDKTRNSETYNEYKCPLEGYKPSTYD